MSYKLNTKNRDDYQYGNKFNLSSSFYYNTTLSESFKIRPNIGFQYEKQQKDNTMGYKIDETGGYNTNANIGLESNIKNVAFGVTYQKAIRQHISQGRTELINKFLTHVTFTF